MKTDTKVSLNFVSGFSTSPRVQGNALPGPAGLGILNIALKTKVKQNVLNCCLFPISEFKFSNN